MLVRFIFEKKKFCQRGKLYLYGASAPFPLLRRKTQKKIFSYILCYCGRYTIYLLFSVKIYNFLSI